MKVLFCTDGSKISYNSIINFSKWTNNCIVDLICVIDWSFLPDTIAVEDTEFSRQCTNSADTILNYTERVLTEKGITVGEKIKMCGSAVDSILDISENRNYDFIVLGSHGKKGLQKWLGSVSQEIASSSNLSTYISKDNNENKSILFAIDSSELSLNVINRSLSFLNLTDKDIYLLTVYEIPDYLFLEGSIDSTWILEVERKQEQAAALMLNGIEKLFNDKGYKVKDKIILNGVPSSKIINFADKQNIDLVITGVRNRKNISRFLLGSVSRRVLENVKSDVLIVRDFNI